MTLRWLPLRHAVPVPTSSNNTLDYGMRRNDE